jgi:hypothetical protein
VKLIEYGFVLPLDPAGPAMTADGQFRLLRLAGIAQQVQYFRVRLTSSTLATGTDRAVFAVSALQPELSDEAVASLATVLSTHLADSVLVFLRKDHPGRAVATSTMSTHAELAAAAVATIKTAAGWDESNPIEVRVDGNDFEVFMVRREQHWFARVAPRAS